MTETATMVTFQSTKGTVKLTVDLPYEASAGEKEYTFTIWARVVSISTSNPELKSIIICQRRGNAYPDGMLIATRENSPVNEI